MTENLTLGRGEPNKVVKVVPGSQIADAPEVDRIVAGLNVVAQSCAEGIGKAVQHYQGDAAWSIGALPATENLADGLEAEARSLLSNSQLSMRHIEGVANHLKSVSDLRTVARCARQVTQLAWLFRQDATSPQAIVLIQKAGEPAVRVAAAVAAAMRSGDRADLRNAALLYRDVQIATGDAQLFLYRDVAVTTFSPTVLRMARSGVWFMGIAGECMARVAARTAG
jgi:hypothetical protein